MHKKYKKKINTLNKYCMYLFITKTQRNLDKIKIIIT